MTDVARPRRQRKRFDPSVAIQLGLAVDVGLRAIIWLLALAITMWWGANADVLPRLMNLDLRDFSQAFTFARRLGKLLLAFNFAYILVLLALRLPIPAPRPGRQRLPLPWYDSNVFRVGLISILTRARYFPPFPAFLVPQLLGIQPLRWLFGRVFGPRTRSSFWGEPLILDPALVSIGKNVMIGYNAILSAHLVGRHFAEMKPIVIEDDVFIGALSAIGPGVRIGRGAIVSSVSWVEPNTNIGPNEYWAGIPARKVKDIRPLDPAPAAPSPAEAPPDL